MKNLKPLTRNFSYFSRIIAQKDPIVRVQLLAIELQVKSDYSKYVRECKNARLSSYTASSYNGINATNLIACYSTAREVKRLKEHIYLNQYPHVRYECQYCTIGDSSESFDHYLPKEHFPEFSVLSNNLIPCCSKCNSHKGANWKDVSGERNIINYYYDTVPNQQFLNCSITFKRRTPVASFSISNPGTIDPASFRLIQRHFTRLLLLERFKKKSNTEITNISNSIRQLTPTHTFAQVAQFLLNDSNQMKASFGNNYWRAILKEALANSNQFFADIGFQP